MKTMAWTFSVLLPFAVMTGCDKEAPTDAPADKAEVAEKKAPEAKGDKAKKKPAATPKAKAPTKVKTRHHTNQRGEKRLWTENVGITVESEKYKIVYGDDRRKFVSVLAKVKVGAAPCDIEWEAQLLDADGKRVRKIQGNRAGLAGQTVSLSDVFPLQVEKAAAIKSLKMQYMTRCGAELARFPNATQVTVGAVKTEEAPFASSTLNIASVELTAGFSAPRCEFDLVREDLDAEGYVLENDWKPVSLKKGGKLTGKVYRMLSAPFSVRKEVKGLIKKTTVHIRSFDCLPKFDEAKAEIKGLEFGAITFAPYTGKKSSGDMLLKSFFNMTLPVKNVQGKDCSFQVFYRVLDKSGFPMDTRTSLSDILHLTAGADLTHTFKHPRFSVFAGQESEIGKVVVRKARVSSDCKSFKAKRALGAK